MGKTKAQIKAKKFDRKVEISAPILDPEVIRAIHSPPKDKKLDIRHGGFKALLSDLNSQDSTDELTPITETHLPSYIGISCAVSGYSNYSSYVNRRPFEDISTNGNELKSARLATSAANSSRLSATPQGSNRSRTSSPNPKQRTAPDQFPINHVTIDKSTISSADQERKELTEKLTASVTERRRAPSPLAPLEDERHHGAYVGARYFPMPEPSKQVQKHIPLLGIDDDQDPDEFVPDETNKVEKKIANLYGEEFVEDWRESMSHKSKKELHEEAAQQQQNENASKNLKDLVTLKPTPPKAEESRDEPINVPTPNVQVLANVEKQFLNKLLTDDNPPMPKSPSPRSMSPLSPRYSRPIMSPISPMQTNIQPATTDSNVIESPRDSPVAAASTPRMTPTPSSPARVLSPPTAEPYTGASQAMPPTIADDLLRLLDQQDSQPTISLEPKRPDSPRARSPLHCDILQRDSPTSPISQRDATDSLVRIAESIPEEREPITRDEIIRLDEQFNVTLEDGDNNSPCQDDRLQAASPNSHDSARSSSTVEEIARIAQPLLEESNEQHIEYEIRTQSPVNNESSPVKAAVNNEKDLITDDFDVVQSTKQHAQLADLVSFSPEPTTGTNSIECNNNSQNSAAQAATNADDAAAKVVDQSDDLINTEMVDHGSDKSQPDLASAAEESSSADQQQQQLLEAKAADADAARDGRYFLSILEREESFIMDQVKSAEARLAEHELEWNEETIGKVRSAIGKAYLLINKKCNQFRELCEKSLVNDANEQYAVLNDDLAGFWDMISIQIADVKRSFENL